MYYFEWTFKDWKFGGVSAVEENGKIVKIGLNGAMKLSAEEYLKLEIPHVKPIRRQTPALKELKRQLDEYFRGKRKSFDLPLATGGTDFQEKVWKNLRKIKYGKLTSYGAVAEAVGKQKAAIAVGQAVGRVPIPIVIPCHRVIGADGSLTGYGPGLDAKRALLELEGAKGWK